MPRQQAEEIGYSLALDGLMEAERQQALKRVKRDEKLKKNRGAQSLQALQEQMAERTAAHADVQVRNGRPPADRHWRQNKQQHEHEKSRL